jgi:hypothetical protein
MTMNRKFENAAAFRSRVALLVALVIHLTVIGYLVLRKEGSQAIFTKKTSPTEQPHNRP